ncbi:hypothetical protein A3Q56_00476 [Intoshia linei]|uniref:COG4 transport protein middle alpha-helical bundle domain-containing protein n=1 Tax=Intoshia linei TaxID=1819745 RepID=A0A177BBR5_9BILA|nr:hypothetical protein A3Q56_00476 [Intoshia linei]
MDTSVSKISENDKNTINALEKSSLKIDKLYNLLNETEAKIQQFDQASIKLTNISKTLNYLYRMTTIINNFINDDTNKTTTLKKLDEKVDLVYIIDSVNKFLQQKDVENAILEFSKLDFYKSHSVNYDKKHNLEIENLKINIIEMLKYSTRQAFYVEDAKIVKNLLKFYPILGLNSFGIEKFSVFICLEISEKCENLEKILEKFDISDINKMAKDDKKLLFSDSISMMFEFVAESIEENQQYIENYYGNGYLNFFIQKFEKEVSYYMRKYLKLMDDYYAVKELVFFYF